MFQAFCWESDEKIDANPLAFFSSPLFALRASFRDAPPQSERLEPFSRDAASGARGKSRLHSQAIEVMKALSKWEIVNLERFVKNKTIIFFWG